MRARQNNFRHGIDQGAVNECDFFGPRRSDGKQSAKADKNARLHSLDSGTAFSAAWKPILEWVPSQNGFSVDAPQRQSAIRFSAGNLLPSLSINSTSPVTMYGPFLIVSIVT